jgi:ABC transport permease subunit
MITHEIKEKFSIKNIKQFEKMLEEINKESVLVYNDSDFDQYCLYILRDWNNRKLFLNEANKGESFFSYLKRFFGKLNSYSSAIIDFFYLILKVKKEKHQKETWWGDVLSLFYTFGVNAIPVVVLMNFSLGVVLALQGAHQLKAFGAELFSVDLVTVSFFKEIGVLLSAILLAARSGGSSTSKIGMMKVYEEWDAIKVSGIDPNVFLLKTRILAFAFAMPLLAYVANFSGIFGGFIALKFLIGIDNNMFFNMAFSNFTYAIFFAALWKAPLFGLIIGFISCFEGQKVKNSAEEVAKASTKGVVYSIVCVILFDTFFNVFFTGIL